LSDASANLARVRDTAFAELDAPAPAFTSALVAILSGQVASGAVTLLTEITYARLLGPAARGVISLCLMSVAFGALVGGLGCEAVIVYWAARSKNNVSSWIPAVSFWGGLGCVASAGLWILGYWQLRLPIFRGISPGSARAVLVTIPAAVLFAFTMALASGTEQFRMRSACAALRQIAGLATFLLFLALLGRNANAALWGNFVGLIAGSLVALSLLRESVQQFSRLDGAFEHLGPTLSYGLRGQIGNLATFFNYRLDVFVVNYFLDSTQLGLYALGVVISEALWQIPQAVASALFPRTARTVERDAKQFTCLVLRQTLLVTSACGLAVALFSPIMIPLIFGRRFAASVAVIWWILPGTTALSLAKVACADLAGRGKNGYSSAAAFICFAMTAGLDWYLIPRMGITGAALASSAAYFVDALLILAALRYEMDVSWKRLLIPTRDDARMYRAYWLRLRSLLRFGAPTVGLNTHAASSRECD